MKNLRILLVAALAFLPFNEASAAVVQIQAKDASGTNRAFNVTTNTDITGNLAWNNVICDQSAGTTCATVTGANALKVDNSAVTQPISAASLPLPTGAATAAGLTTINTTLGSPFQAGGALAANQSVNISQMGGTSIANGCTAALSGLVSTTVPGTVCGSFGSWVLNAPVGTLGTNPGAVPAWDVNANILNLNADGQTTMAASAPVVFASDQSTLSVGSDQISVQVAQTVTPSSAYTTGNAVGNLMTIANAARVSAVLGSHGTGGILQNVAVNSKSVQTAAMEAWIFNANPSGSTCSDKTAFSLVVADFDKVIGVVQIPSTVTNNSGWFSGGTASVGQGNNQAMAYDLASATSLFACLVVRGTPTFTATTDISVKFGLIRS